MDTLFGTKKNMTQTYIEGYRIPVTRINLGPCTVLQIKSQDKEGYWAVQLGFSNKKIKNTTKPLQGHFSKSKTTPRYVKEVKLKKEPEVKVGDTVKLEDIFKKGDVVEVTATSKGKGFAGGMKLHGFHGGPKTHGQSDRWRAPGSIGQTTTPGRVYKGKKMAGRMGTNQITVKNLHVVLIDAEKNEISVSGPVPGISGGFLTVRKIKSGSLKDLEKEVVAQVVEGEPEGEVKEEEGAQPAAQAAAGGQANA